MHNIDKIVDYIQAELPDIPRDAIFLVVVFRVTQIIQHHRVGIDTRSSDTKSLPLLNTYALLFADSGFGKNLLLDRTEELLLLPIIDDIKTEFRKARDRQIAIWVDMENEAREKRNEDAMTKAEQTREIKKLMQKYTFYFEPGSATYQGFMRLRESVSFAGVGATSFVQDELADFMKSTDTANRDLLTLLKSGYHGNTKARVLGTQGSYAEVRGVPISFFGATSGENFMGDNNQSYIQSFFDLGYARRALLCIAKNRNGERLDFDEFLENKGSREDVDDIVINNIAIDIYEWAGTVGNVKMQKSADRILHEFNEDNKELLTQVAGQHFQAEIRDRSFRALKLAGIMAVADGMDIVNDEYIQEAIDIVVRFGEDFANFFEGQFSANEKKLFEYLKTRLGEVVTPTEIYNQGLARSNRAMWLRETTANMPDYLEGKGYELKVFKDDRDRLRYKLVEQGKLRSDDERELIKVMTLLMEASTDKDKIWKIVIEQRDRHKYDVDDDSLAELYDIVVNGKELSDIEDIHSEDIF